MSTPTLPEDLRLAMIAELRSDVSYVAVPLHAMSFEELVAALEVGRDRLRLQLNKHLADGTWRKERVGLGVKYWKVEP